MASQDQTLKLIISAQDNATQAVVQVTNGLKYLENGLTKVSVQVAAFKTAFDAAMDVPKQLLALMEEGARAIRIEKSFAAMADAAEVNADRLLAAMKRASAGLIDDSSIMQKAVFAIGQDVDPNKIPQLLEAARVAALKTGQDVSSTFDSMIQAIATNMPRALRQMGSITKEQMGALNKAIAEGEQNINLLDLVLANAAVDAAKLGDSASGAAERIERFKVQIKETKGIIGKELISLVQALYGLLQGVAGAALLGASGVFKFTEALTSLAAKAAGGIGLTSLSEGLRREAENWNIQAKAALEAGEDLGKKAGVNIFGGGAEADTRSAEQKAAAIAKAQGELATQEAKLNESRIKALREKLEAKASEGIILPYEVPSEKEVLAMEVRSAELRRQKAEEAKRQWEELQKTVERFQEEAQKSLDIEPPNMAKRLEVELDKAQKLREEDLALAERWSQQAQKTIEEPIINMGERLEQALKDPDQFFRKLGKGAEDLGSKMESAFTGWANQFSKNLNDVVWGADFSFGSIAKSFAQMVTQMVIQVGIIEPLIKGLFGGKSGGGEAGFGSILDIGKAALSWIGGFFHHGGIVGQTLTPTISLPAFAFAGAPRLHGGLASDEYPAILQAGETVLPKGQKAGGITVNVHNHAGAEVRTNSIDPNTLDILIEAKTLETMRKNTGVMADAWASEASGGNRQILNTIRRMR